MRDNINVVRNPTARPAHSYCEPVPKVAFTCDMCKLAGEGTPRQKRHLGGCQAEWARRIRAGEIRANGLQVRRVRRNARG